MGITKTCPAPATIQMIPTKTRRASLADKFVLTRLQDASLERRALLTSAGKMFVINESADADADEIQDVPDAAMALLRDRAEAVYQVLSRGTEITVGPQLAEALLILDIQYPNEKCMQQQVMRQNNGACSMDKQDFIKLIVGYEDAWKNKLENVFKDEASFSDVVPAGRVPAMIADAGLALMPGARRDVLRHLEAEGWKKVDFGKFLDVFEIANSRAGLSAREHRRLSLLFEEHERDDGTVSNVGLAEILDVETALLNLAGDKNCINKIVAVTARRSLVGKVNLNLSSWSVDFAALKDSDLESISYARVRFTGSAMLAAAHFLHDRIEHGLRQLIAKVSSHTAEKAGMSGRMTRMSSLNTAFKGSSSPLRATNTYLAILDNIVPLFEEMGLPGMTKEPLEYFVSACGFSEPLDFDQLYTLVLMVCRRYGFTDIDEADLAAIFTKFDADGSGTLGLAELGPLIRELGYAPSQFKTYSFAIDFGLDLKSEFSLRQFRKLVSSYHTMNIQRVREVFVKGSMPGTDEVAPRGITVKNLMALFQMVGYETTREELATVVQRAQFGRMQQTLSRKNSLLSECIVEDDNTPIDFTTFKNLELFHRKYVRSSMQENGGVNNTEHRKFQTYFLEHSEKKDGENFITAKAMRDMLVELFPNSILDRQRHARIAQLVKDADVDGNGMFDFQEFLWLMNRVTEDMDRDGLTKALQLRDKLGFSSEEVKQFKDLFQMSDEDMSGMISLGELVSLLSSLVPLEREAIFQLQARFYEVCAPDRTELDFFEFLTIMRNIQRDNWQNINGIVGKRR